MLARMTDLLVPLLLLAAGLFVLYRHHRRHHFSTADRDRIRERILRGIPD
jgi:cbb3-type cytochrome oxidase subunit 3